MPIPIIRSPRHYRIVELMRVFDFADQPGDGFAFPCTLTGDVPIGQLTPAAARHFAACLAGRVHGRTVIDRGIER
jgi:hypothetical protein